MNKKIALLLSLVVFITLFSGCQTVPQIEEEANADKEVSVQVDEEESTQEPEPKVGVSVGDLAKDFELLDGEGNPVNLSDYRGKRVLLNFFASWCPPCRAEMPDINAVYDATKDTDVVILGINLTTSENSKDDVLDMIEEFGMAFPVVYDEGGDVGNDYRIRSIPTSYFISPEGIITGIKIGAFFSEDEIYSFLEDAY